MAITTGDGKFALMCYNQPFQVILIQPTAPFNQGAKQGLIWQFPEILWQEAPGLPGQGVALVGLVGANPETARGEAEVLGDARGQILLPALGVGIPSVLGPAVGRTRLPRQAMETLILLGDARGQFTLIGVGEGTSSVLGDARGALRLPGQGEA